MRTQSKLQYTTFEVIKDDNGVLQEGVIAKEITSNKFKLLSIFPGFRPRLVGTYDNTEKTLYLTTGTRYVQYDRLMKQFVISVGMLLGLPPTRFIHIKHNGKNYSTSTKYLFYKGINTRNSCLIMNKKDFGLTTAYIWENYVDTRHLNELSVFDLYALRVSFTQYYWALENSEAYRKRFINELVDSADNKGGRD